MANKEKKTARELIDLLMAEVKGRSECDHVLDVAIIRPAGRSWDAAWTVEGNEVACRRAFEAAHELQAKYDLV